MDRPELPPQNPRRLGLVLFAMVLASAGSLVMLAILSGGGGVRGTTVPNSSGAIAPTVEAGTLSYGGGAACIKWPLCWSSSVASSAPESGTGTVCMVGLPDCPYSAGYAPPDSARSFMTQPLSAVMLDASSAEPSFFIAPASPSKPFSITLPAQCAWASRDETGQIRFDCPPEGLGTVYASANGPLSPTLAAAPSDSLAVSSIVTATGGAVTMSAETLSGLSDAERASLKACDPMTGRDVAADLRKMVLFAAGRGMPISDLDALGDLAACLERLSAPL